MAAVDLSAVLERIAYVPEHKPELSPIPWPEGLAPVAQDTALNKDGSLPAADVIVTTFTAAEKMALATLTPGVEADDWFPYSNHWDEYAPQLTGRSPAREAKRLGEFRVTVIGGMRVLCFHSQLHPATDSKALPLAQLAAQIATETGAKLFITTGTAGAVGSDVVLGDVNVATEVRADLTSRLKGQPWSQETWTMTPLTAKQQEMISGDSLAALLEPSASKLPAEYATRAPKVWTAGTIDTDTFAYGTTDDHFGLLKLMPDATMVEMDDFGILVGVKTMAEPPTVISCRDASDPVMTAYSSQSASEASSIYRRYGYLTAVGSVVVCWALIAGLA